MACLYGTGCLIDCNKNQSTLVTTLLELKAQVLSSLTLKFLQDRENVGFLSSDTTHSS